MMPATSSPPDVRQRLRTLSIPKDQRPKGRGASRALGLVSKFLLLAGVGLAGYLAWANRAWLAARLPAAAPSAEVAPIPTLVVREQTEQGTPPVLTATGKIVSDHRVQVVTKVSGQIVALLFEQGDRVAKGQVLARIEDVNYKARRDEAAALLEKAKANLAYQVFERERVMKMAGSGTASDKEIAGVKRSVDEARAQVAADEASLEWFSKALQDTEVVAPIAGVVLERNVEVGDFVAAEGGRGANANAQFASIADMTKLRVEIDISELDVGRVRKGMPCTITPDAYKDRRYTGNVLWIDPGANYAKATVQAKVRIDQPDEYLRVEGSAQVQFRSDDPAEAAGAASTPTRRIWLPQAAVRVGPEGREGDVFVVQDGKAHEARVTLGRSVGGQIEVLSGLTDGQTIVSGELDRVKDGQRISK